MTRKALAVLRSFGRSLLLRSRMESDMDREMRFHVQARADDLEAGGLARVEAERQARAEFGSVLRWKEAGREARGLAVVDDLAGDLRYAVRTLRRAPGFTVAAIASLALGIGSTTALFSVVHAVLLEPFPFDGAERTATVRLAGAAGPPRGVILTARQIRDLRRADVVEDVIAVDVFGTTLTDGDLPEHVRTMFYSSNALTFFGVRPLAGRIFTEDDGPLGHQPRPVAVLTYGFWQSRYAGRREAIGQAIRLDGRAHTIVGVTPSDFLPGLDLIVPIHLRFDPSFAWGIQVRLKPGVTEEEAETRLRPLFRSFAEEAPERFPPDFRVDVTGILDSRRSANFVPPLLLVFAAATILLLVACLTTAILLLARGVSRRQELAIRSAIGATRGRLLRQLLTEAGVLAVSGGVLGVIFARVVTPAALSWLPENSFAFVAPNAAVNPSVLLFSTGLALLTVLVFGLSPALALSGARATAFMRSGAGRIASDVRTAWTHHALVVVQVALAVLLLAGTGAAVQGLLRLYRSPLGYDPTRLLLVTAFLPEGTHQDWAERAEFLDRIRGRITEVPGVSSVGLSVYGGVPPWPGPPGAVEIPGYDKSKALRPIVIRADAGYFATWKIPLVTGRMLSREETLRAAPVAIINRTMARTVWGDTSPIGQRLHLPDFVKTTSQFVLASPTASGWMSVVGVVDDTPNAGLQDPPAPAIYVPHTVMLGDMATFAIRTAGEPLSAVRAVREQVRMVDPSQAVTQVITAERVLEQGGWARERFVTVLLLVFAGFAVLLAVVGLFSVVSFAVTQRRREFGIRIALGSAAHSIVRIALARPLVSTGGGLVAGLVLSAIANRVLARWSIGNLSDPALLGAVALLFLLASIAAVAGPVIRALAVQPSEVLRTD